MKTLCLIVVALTTLWQEFLHLLSYRSGKNPMPANVSDVYDAGRYAKWQAYNKDKNRLAMFSTGLSGLVMFFLLLFNAHAAVVPAGWNAYGQMIAVLVFQQLIDTAIGVAFDWYDTMKIEARYGFNRTKTGTFVRDQIINFCIGLILSVGLMAAFIALYRALGDWIVLLFAALLFALGLGISFLYPVLSRIRNKFTPLEEGELRARLTELMARHGYRVREIQVMDASKRSTKSNAYFTGFGRMKTIVLYDNLLSVMTTDEICAIFAHEMGHGLHKDTLKMQGMSLFSMAAMALLLWLTVRGEAPFRAFGFDGVNYGFALILMSAVELALLSPLFSLVTNAFTRRQEYRADRQAVREGCGEALISGLKKLYREDLGCLAPSRLTVLLSYSHPTLSDRISAIRGK
ncbi:MAG: M48 family metallopeptidase [Clostridia bacterium]|nr:M48 family metallopeptidase [Clostridia bacterium]